MHLAQRFAGTLAAAVIVCFQYLPACTRPNPAYALNEEADAQRPLPVECFTPDTNSDYEGTVSAKICPGEYENVTFTIKGGNVVLDGIGVTLEARDVSDLEYAAISVDTASNVVIRGFTIREYPTGVSATTRVTYEETIVVCLPQGNPDACKNVPATREEGSARLTIEDMAIIGHGKGITQSGTGIQVTGYGRVSITRNTVRKMNVGVMAEDVFHTAITGNTLEENMVGIMLVLRPSFAGDDVVVMDNLIGKNDYGIMRGGANVATISDNKFYENGTDMP